MDRFPFGIEISCNVVYEKVSSVCGGVRLDRCAVVC
jgi:hypothetical protein